MPVIRSLYLYSVHSYTCTYTVRKFESCLVCMYVRKSVACVHMDTQAQTHVSVQHVLCHTPVDLRTYNACQPITARSGSAQSHQHTPLPLPPTCYSVGLVLLVHIEHLEPAEFLVKLGVNWLVGLRVLLDAPAEVGYCRLSVLSRVVWAVYFYSLKWIWEGGACGRRMEIGMEKRRG